MVPLFRGVPLVFRVMYSCSATVLGCSAVPPAFRVPLFRVPVFRVVVKHGTPERGTEEYGTLNPEW